jgi:hypothetical protein
MTPDETQLTARFREGFNTKSNQVLTLNKPSTATDTKKPWVRFSTSLGARARLENGEAPTYLQLGGVLLQVFVPKALGANGGDDLIAKFDDLFCDWTSSDGALQIGRMERSRSEEADNYQINIRFAFQSTRQRT